MRSEIKMLHQKVGTTIVYVTHDQIEAMTLADRIAIMKDGVLEQFGMPREIYENPASIFVAGFIGSPSMNFISGEVIEYNGKPHFPLLAQNGERSFIPLKDLCENPETLEDKTVILGIRPEQIGAFSSTEQENNPVYKLTCPVQITEPTGPDTLVFIQINDQKTTCRIHPDKAVLPGESMALGFDISKAILFDPKTEKRI